MTDYALKMPAKPPSLSEEVLFPKEGDTEIYAKAFRAGMEEFRQQRYDHWDKFRRRKAPEGLTAEQWWYGAKLARSLNRKYIDLEDVNGKHFSYVIVDTISEMQHRVDLSTGGQIGIAEPVTNSEEKDRYLISSLVQEAITSSQIEGALTTREVAKEMLRTNRRPQNRDEQMILNNYLTMRHIGKIKEQPLSPEVVFELHRQMTKETLDNPDDAGCFRGSDRKIEVGDDYGQIAHVPPPADQLPARLKKMCDFANGKSPDRFVHPVVRSIILHFWLAYDHPFVDGNGRAARALFYWSMLRSGYWLFEYVSISQVILDSNRQYYRAFLHTETDENDLTYFILYHLKVINQAINRLHQYIERKAEQARALDSLLRSTVELNHRQRALLSHALRHPGQRYTTESHRTSHGVVYQTARNDLLDLTRRKLLTASKRGKTDYFAPVKDLEQRLQKIR